MTNKKDPYLEVFNGEKWEKQDKKIAIQNMITTKKDIMDDYFDEQVEKNIISTFIKITKSPLEKFLKVFMKVLMIQIKYRMRFFLIAFQS